LGGDGIPVAHTVLIVAENDVFAQWLCESPPLLVNGKAVHETALCEGDHIGIGRFEFIVHRLLTETAAKSVATPKSLETSATRDIETAALLRLLAQAKTDEPADDLAELSASDLSELIETEQSSVDHFEDAVRDAEAALLYAVAQHAENLADESESEEHPLTMPQPGDSRHNDRSEPGDPEILDELERVIQQLSGFSSELELRAKRIAAEEATQAEAAEMLLDAQKELASQLERFHKQMSESQEHSEPKLRRAA
jgi:hypothetical protein